MRPPALHLHSIGAWSKLQGMTALHMVFDTPVVHGV